MSPNTPGPGGYLAAVLVAFAWNALFLGGGMGPVGWIGVLGLSFVYGLPVAVTGVAIVHLFCRRVRHQGVHVTLAAVAGLVLTPSWFSLLAGDAMASTAVAISVGVSAGLGRLAVVPTVHRRQGRFASRPPLRVT